MFCTHCGKELSEEETVCPACGVPADDFTPDEPPAPPSGAADMSAHPGVAPPFAMPNQPSPGFGPPQYYIPYAVAPPPQSSGKLIGMTPRVFWLVFAYLLTNVLSFLSSLIGGDFYLGMRLIIGVGVIAISIIMFVFALLDRKKGCSVAIPIVIFSITAFSFLMGLTWFLVIAL